MIYKLLLIPSITAFCCSSLLVAKCFVEQKADISLPGTSWMNLLILNRSKGSQGMRFVPVGKVSATYQEIKSLSAIVLLSWMRIGTFPSDVVSPPQALLQIYVNHGSLLTKLASLLQKSTFFQSKVNQTLCAKGQMGLVIKVTALEVILITVIQQLVRLKALVLIFLTLRHIYAISKEIQPNQHHYIEDYFADGLIDKYPTTKMSQSAYRHPILN